MDQDELQTLVDQLGLIRMWLQRSLVVPPSKDDQLTAVHILGRLRSLAVKEQDRRRRND